MVVDVHLMIVAHRLFLIKAYRICNILSTTFSYYLSIISTKAGTPCFHSVPAFFVFTGSVYLLHQSTYSILTPHRFVRLLFGKTSQNWCSCGVVPQISPEFHLKIHHIYVLILHFTAQSASSWGCCKIRLCFRPTESNSIHEIGRFRWEQSNKLQHCPRKLYTVLVKTPFSGVLTVTRTAFGAGGRT